MIISLYSRRKLSTIIILFYVQILWSKISADYAVCRLLNRWKIRSTKFFRAELSGDDEDLLTRICTLGSAPHWCFVPRRTSLISTHHITHMFHLALDCKIVVHHFKQTEPRHKEMHCLPKNDHIRGRSQKSMVLGSQTDTSLHPAGRGQPAS